MGGRVGSEYGGGGAASKWRPDGATGKPASTNSGAMLSENETEVLSNTIVPELVTTCAARVRVSLYDAQLRATSARRALITEPKVPVP